jgi:EAL domain-containing protein (putative c-di-GMP-specific phosphodiesterase class I)/ActR/RegA family two-component response regulator
MPEMQARILLVDDEPDLLAVNSDILRSAGFDVTACTSGRAAIEALASGAFDAVISDIRMPGLDGMGVLRAVREHDVDLPVVLTTGDPSLEGVSEALDQGVLHYLIKPVPLEKLVDTARRAVRLGLLARLKRDALHAQGESDHLIGDRIGLEAAFARALKSLHMVYQPIVHADGSGFGCEALVRCGEPLFPHPGSLFLAAERLGRLFEVGRAIRVAVADTLGRQGLPGLAFVNLHPLELNDGSLLDPHSPLSRFAANVVLEVTERAHLDNVRNVTDRVARLRELGFRIALDDLGGGYAGLTSFAALVPDFVKIDGELVKGIDQHELRRRLVASIARVCTELGIPVVAEGIETASEREEAVSAGCELLQGFLIGRPAPPAAPGLARLQGS